MAKRRIVVEVDCGKRFCKRCIKASDESAFCYQFAEGRKAERDRYLRLPACIDAEELSKYDPCEVDDLLLYKWGELADSLAALYSGPVASQAANALRAAVAALVAKKEVA